jgi:hypothetical protein
MLKSEFNNDYSILDFQEDADMFNDISGSSTACTKKDIGNQIALMQEEVQETYDAYVKGNMVETLDGCIDTLYVALGLLQKLNNLGIDTEGAMRRVAYDNIQKFPISEMVAEETVKMYSEKGIEVLSKYDVLHNVYVIKDMNDKVKKPWGFMPTDLSQYVSIDCYMIKNIEGIEYKAVESKESCEGCSFFGNDEFGNYCDFPNFDESNCAAIIWVKHKVEVKE